MLEKLFNLEEKYNDYQETGVVNFEGLLSPSLLDQMEDAYDRVMQGNYQSGNAPPRRTNVPEESFNKLTRVSFPTLPDPNIVSLLMEAGVGVISSKLLQSKFSQAFFIHLVNKVPGDGVQFNISWHQDGQYGKNLFSGDWVTAHIALDDVGEEDAPLLYVHQSHHLPPLNKREISGFSFQKPLEELGRALAEKTGIEWKVVRHLTKKGDITFHDSRLIHATGNILSGRVRKTFVAHIRGEHNKLLFSDKVFVTNEPPNPSYYVDIKDPLMCPTLHGVATDLL